MSQRDDGLYLGQMLDYARTIEQEVTNLSHSEFDDDNRLQKTVILLIQHIGEAARHVSPTFKDTHAEIDWAKIIGMRHRLVHGYDQINLNLVWSTATEDIPHLVTTLANLLP
jgi:uncharacterized protein with HEPN domain